MTGASEGTDTVLDTVELFQFANQTLTRTQLLSGLTPPSFTENADTVTLSFLDGSFNALGGDDRLSYAGGSVRIKGGAGTDTFDLSLSVRRCGSTSPPPTPQTRRGRRIRPISLAAPGGRSPTFPTWRTWSDGPFGQAVGRRQQRTSLHWRHRYVDGRGGTDTADFSRFGSAVWVDLALHQDRNEAWTQTTPTRRGTWREIADLTSIENLTGTDAADQLFGNANVNRLEGGAGNDSSPAAAETTSLSSAPAMGRTRSPTSPASVRRWAPRSSFRSAPPSTPSRRCRR